MHYPQSNEPETSALDGNYRPEFKRFSGRWYFRVTDPGEILEVDALVIDADEWSTRPESNDPTWRPRKFGSVVLAIKALF
jgi:hypothetical protein